MKNRKTILRLLSVMMIISMLTVLGLGTVFADEVGSDEEIVESRGRGRSERGEREGRGEREERGEREGRGEREERGPRNGGGSGDRTGGRRRNFGGGRSSSMDLGAAFDALISGASGEFEYNPIQQGGPAGWTPERVHNAYIHDNEDGTFKIGTNGDAGNTDRNRAQGWGYDVTADDTIWSVKTTCLVDPDAADDQSVGLWLYYNFGENTTDTGWIIVEYRQTAGVPGGWHFWLDCAMADGSRAAGWYLLPGSDPSVLLTDIEIRVTNSKVEYFINGNLSETVDFNQKQMTGPTGYFEDGRDGDDFKDITLTRIGMTAQWHGAGNGNYHATWGMPLYGPWVEKDDPVVVVPPASGSAATALARKASAASADEDVLGATTRGDIVANEGWSILESETELEVSGNERILNVTAPANADGTYELRYLLISPELRAELLADDITHITFKLGNASIKVPLDAFYTDEVKEAIADLGLDIGDVTFVLMISPQDGSYIAGAFIKDGDTLHDIFDLLPDIKLTNAAK